VRDLEFDIGLRLPRDGVREGEDGGPGRFCLQPPAVVQEPPRQPRLSELNGDDLCHAATMHGAFAVRLSEAFRICGLLCRFRADEALDAAVLGSDGRKTGRF
jgi:hypothetical protein